MYVDAVHVGSAGFADTLGAESLAEARDFSGTTSFKYLHHAFASNPKPKPKPKPKLKPKPKPKLKPKPKPKPKGGTVKIIS